MTGPEPTLSRWRWLFYAAGAAMIAFGAYGQMFGADTSPRRYVELLLVAAVAHDLLIAPIVLGLGLLSRRLLPRNSGASVQGALFVGVMLVFVAVPGIGRYGARTDNATILPRDYRFGLLVCLGVVGVVTGAQMAFGVARRRRGAGAEAGTGR